MYCVTPYGCITYHIQHDNNNKCTKNIKISTHEDPYFFREPEAIQVLWVFWKKKKMTVFLMFSQANDLATRLAVHRNVHSRVYPFIPQSLCSNTFCGCLPPQWSRAPKSRFHLSGTVGKMITNSLVIGTRAVPYWQTSCSTMLFSRTTCRENPFWWFFSQKCLLNINRSVSRFPFQHGWLNCV